MTRNEEIAVQSIHDLASARLRNTPLDPHVEHDLREITRIANDLLAAAPAPSGDPIKDTLARASVEVASWPDWKRSSDVREAHDRILGATDNAGPRPSNSEEQR